jgi:hypothetical protein
MDSGSAPRVMGRQLARTLTDAELNYVSGGVFEANEATECTATYTGCGSYGCSDGDKK